MTYRNDILHDPVLLNTLDAHAGVEIHLSDVAFTQGGKARVFWNGDMVGEADDVRKALEIAVNRIQNEKTVPTCKMCGEPIQFGGKFWEHINSTPRHPATPVDA